MEKVDTAPIQESTFVYLEPEIGEKWYITIALMAFTFTIIGVMIWGFKQYWNKDKNKCNLGPYVGSFFGLTTDEWIQKCVAAPLEGNFTEIKRRNEIDKQNVAKKHKSTFEKLRDELMKMMTRIKIASRNLNNASRNI